MELNAGGIIPPLKYRVLYRDHFGDEGASHASDLWNYTTIKRILKNEVYLGHTLLGKTRKASIRSEKKFPSRRRIGQSRAARICRLFRRRHLTLRR